jgi:hypothetical protein
MHVGQRPRTATSNAGPMATSHASRRWRREWARAGFEPPTIEVFRRPKHKQCFLDDLNAPATFSDERTLQ